MRQMLVGLLVIALAQAVGAQYPSTLDTHISGDFRMDHPRDPDPCAIGLAVDQIARFTHTPVGFENTRDCWLSPQSLHVRGSGEFLSNISARQALDHLMTLVPTYRWQEMHGVAVVRPNDAWDDPRDPLNLPTSSFKVTDAHVDHVLHMVLNSVTPRLFVPHVDVPQPIRQIDSPVSVTFPGGTMLNALNALVRAQGAEWQLGYADSDATILVSTLAFSGGSVTVPVALPRTTR